MALTDNIQGYWKLDESSGNASDSVASNTLTNNNTVSYSAAKINNGADFGSSNTNKSLSTTSAVGPASFATAHSYSFWVNVTTAPTSGNAAYLFFNDFSDGNSRVTYNNSGGTLQIQIQRGSGGFLNTATNNYTLTTGTWFHVVFTYAGSGTGTGKLYVNGSLQSNQLTSTSTTGGGIGPEFAIALRKNDLSLPFSGKVDEFGVWSRELTSDEVTQLYNSGNGVQYPFTSGPTNMKTWNGLAKANIKTINGVPIADIKTWNGLS